MKRETINLDDYEQEPSPITKIVKELAAYVVVKGAKDVNVTIRTTGLKVKVDRRIVDEPFSVKIEKSKESEVWYSALERLAKLTGLQHHETTFFAQYQGNTYKLKAYKDRRDVLIRRVK